VNDLIDFLRARYDDAEQDIRDSRAVTPGELHWSMPDWLDRNYLLADIEAKRRIVDWCAEVIGDRDLSRYHEFGSLSEDKDALAVTLAVETLRLLALSHAKHPDYREEWQPGA
jgi:hypothetical protein